jgi:penicillin amidase
MRAARSRVEPSVRGRLLRRIGAALGAVLFGVVLVALLGTLYLLRGSLPRLDGRLALAGLGSSVSIERDGLGVPTIRGANRDDVARATGFLHGQERFFQMDLLRRSAAGELAELFGEGALPIDRRARVHRFRALADRIVADLPPTDRGLLEAYAEGVNAGLAELNVVPFEYLLLRARPVPWAPRDCLLVIYAMYLKLQAMIRYRESTQGIIEDVLPGALAMFLTPRGTGWDAPLRGGPLEPSPVPDATVLDGGRPGAGDVPSRRLPAWPEIPTGSNNWALAGAYTVHGGALLANDMHLPLGVPNIWYRASLVYPDDAGSDRRITGVTLPGMPAIVVGSNGRVAWGFTNSEGDWSDLVVLEPPGDGSTADYLTPDGPDRFVRYREVLRTKKDSEEQVFEVLWTRWGPVVDRDHRGRLRALRWVAHDAQGVNLNLLALEGADNRDEALDIANRAGITAQNFLVADVEGRIGWTIAGPVPRRFGHDGRFPRSWADGARGWNGWLAPKDYPRIVDPASGRLWTANARTMDGGALARLGDGGYALGARARQIRDGLAALEQADEADMLALQLDDRAVLLARWRDLLLEEVLTPETLGADPRRRALREQIERWDGTAAASAVGYRLVREFRDILAAEIFAALTAACRRVDPNFQYGWIRQWEGPLWRLIEQRPLHLLDARYASWRDQMLAAVDALLGAVPDDASRLSEYTWGEHNTSRIRHPLSPFLPLIGRWLDMPALPLPGDHYMPRVQTPGAGASQRMVVSPGREAQGIFHMPGGQSGHPLSPHYRDGHRAWAEGEATPFLPGPTRYKLMLDPKTS